MNKVTSTCPVKVYIGLEKNGASFSSFTGVTTLSPKLENVVGMKILFSSTYVNPSSSRGGTLWCFKSAALGSRLVKNNWYTSTTQNTTVSTAEANSNIIGMSSLSLSSTPIFEGYRVNTYLPFSSPTDIHSFDWVVEAAAGTFTYTGGIGTVEIIIAFYQESQ